MPVAAVAHTPVQAAAHVWPSPGPDLPRPVTCVLIGPGALTLRHWPAQGGYKERNMCTGAGPGERNCPGPALGSSVAHHLRPDHQHVPAPRGSPCGLGGPGCCSCPGGSQHSQLHPCAGGCFSAGRAQLCGEQAACACSCIAAPRNQACGRNSRGRLQLDISCSVCIGRCHPAPRVPKPPLVQHSSAYNPHIYEAWLCHTWPRPPHQRDGC